MGWLRIDLADWQPGVVWILAAAVIAFLAAWCFGDDQ